MQHDEDTLANTNYTASMSEAQFRFAQRRYPILIVNFYAPWCPWCQRLAPTWEAVMSYAHSTYPTSDGRIRIAKVDCTAEVVRSPPSPPPPSCHLPCSCSAVCIGV